MRFKLDENVPSELADDLSQLGHEAHTVFDEGPAGTSDPVVLAAAHSEARVLLTLDKGIASLPNYSPEQFSGVVLFRPDATGRATGLFSAALGGRAARLLVADFLPTLPARAHVAACRAPSGQTLTGPPRISTRWPIVGPHFFTGFTSRTGAALFSNPPEHQHHGVVYVHSTPLK